MSHTAAPGDVFLHYAEHRLRPPTGTFNLFTRHLVNFEHETKDISPVTLKQLPQSWTTQEAAGTNVRRTAPTMSCCLLRSLKLI